GGGEQALHVDGDHAVPLPGVRAEDGAQEHQAGVVDRDVDSPELPGRLLDGRLGLGAVGDVRFDGQRGAACVLDVGGAGLQAVAAAIPLLAPVTSAAVPASFGVMGVVRLLWMYGTGAGGGASSRGAPL